MSYQSKDQRRFKNRRNRRLSDIVHPFESQPSSHHVRYAIGAIQRLREDGRRFWEADSDEFNRWYDGCTDLLQLFSSLGQRRDIEKLQLETVLREFIQKFEHMVFRMEQMLHSVSGALETDPAEVDAVFRWIDLVYRLATYGLVSAWLDDKTEERHTSMTIKLTTGEILEETKVVKEMRIPRKYRSSARLGRRR